VASPYLARLAAIRRASTDGEPRAERQAILDRRLGGLTALVEALARGPGTGVGRVTAIAILDALTIPRVYAQLVLERGWSSDAYERWLAAVPRDHLVGR
jgi:hypothetical protein